MSTNVPKANSFLRMPLSGAATFTTSPFDISQYPAVWMIIEWTPDATTNATMGLRFSVDQRSNLAYPIPFGAANGYQATSMGQGSTGAATALTITASAFTVPVTAGNAFFQFVNPPPNLELVYTRTAGAPQFLVSIFGRSA